MGQIISNHELKTRVLMSIYLHVIYVNSKLSVALGIGTSMHEFLELVKD